MSRIRHRSAWLAACAGLALWVAAPALATEKKASEPGFELHVEGDNGESVHFTLSTGWLAGLLEVAHVSCATHVDSETREMMEALEKGGEGAVHEMVDHDGDRVIARRREGQLRLEVSKDEGDHVTLEMPWSAARCLLLGLESGDSLARRIADGKAKIRVDVREHDDQVRIRID